MFSVQTWCVRHALRSLILVGLAACGSLPPAAPQPGASQLLPLREEAAVRLSAVSGWAPAASAPPRLARLNVVRSAGVDAEAAATQDALPQPIEAAFGMLATDPDALQLDVTLSDIRPVSPSLNLLSTLVVLLPLDTGSVQLSATVRSAQGEVLAQLDERLSGRWLDVTKGFDPYAHLQSAVAQWAGRCAQWPACFTR